MANESVTPPTGGAGEAVEAVVRTGYDHFEANPTDHGYAPTIDEVVRWAFRDPAFRAAVVREVVEARREEPHGYVVIRRADGMEIEFTVEDVCAALLPRAADAPTEDDPRAPNVVQRFWMLRSSERREIMLGLGALSQDELTLPDTEKYGRSLLRIAERGERAKLDECIARYESPRAADADREGDGNVQR